MRDVSPNAGTLLSDLQTLQDNIARATGMATALVEAGGEPITRVSGQTPLFERILANTAGQKLCQASVLRLCRMVREAQAACTTVCSDTGLLMAALPVFLKGRQMACWLIGQARRELPWAYYSHYASALAAATGLSPVELSALYRGLPVLHEASIGASLRLLQFINLQLAQSAFFLPGAARQNPSDPAENLTELFAGWHSAFPADSQYMKGLLEDFLEMPQLPASPPAAEGPSPST